MSGHKFLLDTNTILYILQGDEALADLLYDGRLYVSFITEMELLSYRSITPKEQQQIKRFLSEMIIVNINEAIKQEAVSIKRKTYLKLPDSIIAATSTVLDIPLVSADKQFRTIDGLSFLLYEK